jgi:hypothetical protein
MLGLSLMGWFRYFLNRWGAPWFFWFLVPIIAVAILARKETEWLPDVELRMRCSRWLVLGSIVLAALLSTFGSKPQRVETPPAVSEPQGRARVQGR